MRILLVSTYELGRQPFGLASPAACLRADGHDVACADLAVEKLSVDAARVADLIAFYLPMHTATRLAACVIEAVRRVNPTAHLCCYGLYAPVNAGYLRSLGVETILGGEFEDELRRLARTLEAGDRDASAEPLVSLERIRFEIPDRSGLPSLSRYATMFDGETDRVTGYTEASRGCKHLCRHCRCRDGRHTPGGGSRGTAYYIRRSGFFQRPDARDAHRSAHEQRVSGAYV